MEADPGNLAQPNQAPWHNTVNNTKDQSQGKYSLMPEIMYMQNRIQTTIEFVRCKLK